MPFFSFFQNDTSTAGSVKRRLDGLGVSEKQRTTHDNINSLVKLRGAKSDPLNHRRGQVDVMVHCTLGRNQDWTQSTGTFAREIRRNP
ncbi:hypothetical protein FNU76_11075 [Chitinimonas arctica]|uniref:Uncharacterized protein n=1 Tax=Chitinimonas arctica TaxID=2594795 RepID=A0A516SFF0_9NEIS|nr:hypothetical protein [Chitinimonas arctica]QDQ26862.1 hypothetical protein FNU76_11075 [Chitinimonas arctica]